MALEKGEKDSNVSVQTQAVRFGVLIQNVERRNVEFNWTPPDNPTQWLGAPAEA
jgi:hypothetical protein